MTPLLYRAASFLLSPSAKWRLAVLKHTAQQLRVPRQPTPRVCTICGYQGFFSAVGWPIRPEARCPHCGSLERHRLFALWLRSNHDKIAEKRVLHFAPEPCLSHIVQPLAASYVTADKDPGKAQRQIDIEQMNGIEDDSVDLAICSHVLEHVDDLAALAEIRRVLAPRGIAIIMVPVIEGWSQTYENADLKTPGERELHYGQNDHVRYYGADIRDRIRVSGLSLTEFTACEPGVSNHGLLRGEKMFICSVLK